MLAKIGTHTERFSLFDTVELKHRKEWIEAIITALSGHLVHVQFAAKDMCFQRQLRIDSHLMAKAGTHLEHWRRRDWSTPNENANILPRAYDVDDPMIYIRSEEQNLPLLHMKTTWRVWRHLRTSLITLAIQKSMEIWMFKISMGKGFQLESWKLKVSASSFSSLHELWFQMGLLDEHEGRSGNVGAILL